MSKTTASNILISMIAVVATLGLLEWRVRTQIPSEVDRLFDVKPKDVLQSVRDLQESLVADRVTSDWLLEIIDHSGESWCIVDSGGLVKAWSAGMTRLTGIERDQAIGYGLAILLPADQRESHRKALVNAHSKDRKSSVINYGRCKTLDGEVEVSVETWTLPGRLSAARIRRIGEE